MTIKLKKPNLKRLASLSALGAGALGVNAGTAEAYVVYSGVINKKVGYGSGYATYVSIPLPNGAALALRTDHWTYPTYGSLNEVNLNAMNVSGPNGTQASFRAVNNPWGDVTAFVLAAPQGAKFGTSPREVRNFGWVAISGGGKYHLSNAFTEFNPTDRYLLFRFTGGKLPYTIYGWAQLSVTLPGHFAGPQVTLTSWAYETSGAQLPAGVHGKALDGSDDISEIRPSTFDATGLPALALGSLGVRKWRDARKMEAAKSGA